MGTIAALDRVTKRFREHTAVNDFSMAIPDNAIYGFIGPNGSGKTTSIRMILGIIEPDAGTVAVFGKAPDSAIRDRVGYLPEERGLYRKMTVLQQLVYFGTLKGMTRRDAKRAALAWLDRLSLGSWHDKKLEALSKGMGQKIQFIATVIARPQLLILDEPFSGLDPVNLEVLREALLDLKRQGTTLIFSTHDMYTAESFCDHICMIYQGSKVLDGSMREIQASYGQDTVRLRFSAPVEPDAISRISATSDWRNSGRDWEMRFNGEPSAILQTALACGPIDHFEVVHPSLHDIFLRIARPAGNSASVSASNVSSTASDHA